MLKLAAPGRRFLLRPISRELPATFLKPASIFRPFNSVLTLLQNPSVFKNQRPNYSFFSTSSFNPGTSTTTTTQQPAKKDEENESSLQEDKHDAKLNVDTLRRLADFSKPEHSLIGWSAATLFVTSSTTLVLPAASGQVLDMIMSGDPSVSPTLVATGLFGLTALAGGGVYARTLWLQQAGNTLVARLKHTLYHSILKQEMAYLDRMKTGDLVTRLSQDTTMIQSVVTTQAVAALRALVMLTGSAVMLFQTSTTLAFVSLGTLPPLFLAARHVGQKLREKQRHVQNLHSKATAIAEEGLNGISTVVQFGAQSQEVDRYATAAHWAHDAAIRTGKTQAFFDGAVHIGANGAILCVLGYGGSMVVAGTITAGELTGFLMYSLLLAGNVSSLSGTYAEVMKAVAAADRVWEIIDRQPTIPSGVDKIVTPTLTKSGESFNEIALTTSSDSIPRGRAIFDHPLPVEFRNIQFAYPTRPDERVLGPNFSLHVRPGEVLALVGGSGSGKSTLASLLTRLYDIDDNTNDGSSAILVNDRDIREWDPDELRRQVIGIVSQEPWLLDGTIKENILYGRPTASDEEVEEAARHANVLPFVTAFPKGLQTRVGPRGTQLSGGQRQRVALARLILKDPPIVVLDEATSALDAQSEYHVKQAIDSAMQGRTVISIAHRLSTIRGADRIAVLLDGQIQEIGTFEELSKKEGGAFHILMGRQLISPSPA